ncbi:unnamed protein product, partial [marine sediment metagenome]
MDYELGFQLIDTADDYKKAIGVIGFQIGRQLFQVPVFFLNGQLKGQELLYLQNSDTFVPLKENWVNYLLNRKPLVIGDETSGTPTEMGAERPSLEVLRESPSKYASAAYDMSSLVYGKDHCPSHELVLPRLLKESSEASLWLLRTLDAYPALAQPIVNCYGKALISEAVHTVKAAGSIFAKKKMKKRAAVRGSIFRGKVADPNEKLRIFIYDENQPE